MGYGLVPYQVDLESLCSVLGAKDRNYISGFLQYRYNELLEVDELAEDLLSDNEKRRPALEVAIDMLTKPNYKDPNVFIQGRIIEVMILSFGSTERLDNAEWYRCSIPDFLYFDSEISQYSLECEKKGIFSGVESPLFLIKHEFAQNVLDRFIEKYSQDINHEAVDEFSNWIKSSIEKKLDLAIYYY
ncbi:hypothetical protein MHO82_07300 [Vibrio sp. Of7-15]|uniref:DUF7691 family protein n=1 Tax=Vibrio sp. Of7-15 TaxID=2724879 RepID=UPI001EF1AE99|nr:hypothetical protein [Vibrio sp. Of7-15]MCG7496664.1 hypothetical protein [Vibrio sp. Of7-15]